MTELVMATGWEPDTVLDLDMFDQREWSAMVRGVQLGRLRLQAGDK